MKSPVEKIFISIVSFLVGAPLSSAQVGPITFEIPTDFTNNFRQVLAPTSGTVSVATDSTPNSYVNVVATSGTYVGAYDTTPGNSTDAHPTFSGAFTIKLSVSAADAGSSFGVYLFETGNANNNLTVIFNLDATAGGAGNEQFRFWSDSSVGTGNVGTPYTTASGFITGTGGLLDAGTNSYVTTATNSPNMTVDTSNPFTFYELTFEYNPTAKTLKATAPGGFSSTLAIPDASLILNPAIALRINDTAGAGSAKFDNFGVAPLSTSTSTYSGWAATNSTSSDPNADSDNDGIPNGVEYGLDTNPTASDGAPGTYTGNVLSFKKRALTSGNSDLSYRIEVSTDLGITVAWTELTSAQDEDSIEATVPTTGLKNFARLRVMVNP